MGGRDGYLAANIMVVFITNIAAHHPQSSVGRHCLEPLVQKVKCLRLTISTLWMLINLIPLDLLVAMANVSTIMLPAKVLYRTHTTHVQINVFTGVQCVEE